MNSIHKAGSKALTPVFDSAGNLIGVVDPDEIQELATPPGQQGKPSQADVNANAAQVQANSAAGQQQSAAQLTKACAEALAPVKPPRADAVRKATPPETFTEGWAALIKSLDANAAARVKATVSFQGMRIAVGQGIPAGQALNIAKRAMVLTARSRGLV